MKKLIIFFILSLVLGKLSFASQAIEPREYRAGKLAAYADYCGMSSVTQKLFDVFGKTRAYKTGYSENYIWTNNNTPSLSSKCDEGLREAARKLLEIQPTGNKPTGDAIHESNFSNPKICKLALAPVDNIWDYSTFASKEAIREARDRGLTIRSCAELLGRAKRLNSDTQNKPGNTIVSSETDIDICKIALSKTITAWNPTIYAETSVKEARKRNLLPSDCARILATGQQKTASDRPSIANGTTLPKGTQTKQLDLAKRLAHLERLLVQHQNDNNNLKQELNRLKATERQNLLSIERLKKKQDQLLADLNLIIRINQDGIEKLARIDKKKFDALKPLLERKHSRKKEEAARKAEERRKAAEAARKAEERRKAAEATRKAEERRKAAEAARKAEAKPIDPFDGNYAVLVGPRLDNTTEVKPCSHFYYFKEKMCSLNMWRDTYSERTFINFTSWKRSNPPVSMRSQPNFVYKRGKNNWEVVSKSGSSWRYTLKGGNTIEAWGHRCINASKECLEKVRMMKKSKFPKRQTIKVCRFDRLPNESDRNYKC